MTESELQILTQLIDQQIDKLHGQAKRNLGHEIAQLLTKKAEQLENIKRRLEHDCF